MFLSGFVFELFVQFTLSYFVVITSPGGCFLFGKNGVKHLNWHFRLLRLKFSCKASTISSQYYWSIHHKFLQIQHLIQLFTFKFFFPTAQRVSKSFIHKYLIVEQFFSPSPPFLAFLPSLLFGSLEYLQIIKIRF